MLDEAHRPSEGSCAPAPQTLAELAAAKRAAEAPVLHPQAAESLPTEPLPAWSHPVKEDKAKAPPVVKSAAPAPAAPTPPPIVPRPIIIPRDRKLRVASALPVDPEADLAFKLNPHHKSAAPARRRDMPCWLSSLMLHMLVVIVLGSIMSPPSKQTMLKMMVLLVGDAEAAPAVADFVVLQADAQTAKGGEQGQHREPERGADATTIENPFQSPDLDRAFAQAEPTVVLKNTTQFGAAAPENGSRPAVQTPTEGAVVGRISNPPAPQPPSLTDGRQRTPEDLERQRDDIVDRFTQFDIGELRGEEGHRALREFDALGPESIPALVRGLNRAAKISSSCPVLVISQKLQTAISYTRDPSSLRYAIDNLGRDVPASAAHAGVIRSLRDRLGVSTQLAVMEKLQARGLTPSNQIGKRVEALSHASPEVLAKAMQSSDRETRLVAAMVAGEKPADRTDATKAKLALPLIQLLRDPLARGDAHRALMALFRDPPTDLAGEPVDFDFNRDISDQRQYDAEAYALLIEARKLEVFAGPRKSPTFDDYRKVIKKFLDATSGEKP